MTNLFQQQAEQQLALSESLRNHNHQCALEHARSCRPHERMELLAALMKGASIDALMRGATIEQCGEVATYLSAQLFALEKYHSGMKAANLNEAAHFVADAAVDINGALSAENAVPCVCGRCDECRAASSDVAHDRFVDAQLTKGE